MKRESTEVWESSDAGHIVHIVSTGDTRKYCRTICQPRTPSGPGVLRTDDDLEQRDRDRKAGGLKDTELFQADNKSSDKR